MSATGTRRLKTARERIEEFLQEVDNARGAAAALQIVVEADADEFGVRDRALCYLATEIGHQLYAVRDYAETQMMRVERVEAAHLRRAIGRELEARSITTPAQIGAALGVPPDEAPALLNRDYCRKGDMALLEAAAVRLGVRVPKPASA